jgi:hypothetical protein
MKNRTLKSSRVPNHMSRIACYREGYQLTPAAEALAIAILCATEQQRAPEDYSVDDLAAWQSEGLIPGWEKYMNSQRGDAGAVATIAILLFPPQKSRLFGRVGGIISMEWGLSRRMTPTAG